MRFFKLNWRKWQHVIFGVITGIGSDEENKENERVLQNPTDFVFTPIGLFAILSFIGLCITEFIIRLTVAKILRQKFNTSDDNSWMALIAKSNDSEKWMEEKGIVKISLTFEEEYVFYKYYRTIANWGHKKKYRKYIPAELDSKADDSKRNYLAYRLSGTRESLN